jgi:hypothetical protein
MRGKLKELTTTVQSAEPTAVCNLATSTDRLQPPSAFQHLQNMLNKMVKMVNHVKSHTLNTQIIKTF